MSNFEQTKQVLGFAKKFHHQLSELYHRISEKSKKERVKILCDYLSRHETNLEIKLNEYEKDLTKEILETWFQFLPDHKKPKCIEEIEFDVNEDVDEIIDLALEMDDCLLNIYKRIAQDTEDYHVKDVFYSLYHMGTRDKMKFIESTNRFQEL